MTFEEFCVQYVKNSLDDGSIYCTCCPLSKECEKDTKVETFDENPEDFESCADFIKRFCGGQ